MKKIISIAAVFILLFNTIVCAQNPQPKKKYFSLDPKTMTELGLTDAQKKNIEDLRNVYRADRSKNEAEIKTLENLLFTRLDSMSTADQKQKMVAAKAAYPANKPLVLSSAMVKELALTPEQDQKFKMIYREYSIAKSKLGKAMNERTASAIAEQENVLTAPQKQKMAEMKTAIDEYNKSIAK